MATEKDGSEKLTGKQRLVALLRIAKISYQTAPSVVYVRGISAVLDSVLPIATTFFAAQTTTELARAYNGEAGAGEAAITYVIVTAILGIVTLAWSTVEDYITRLARYKLEAAISDELISHFLSLDYWRYDDKQTADLLDKSRRFSNFFTYIFDTLGRVVSAIIGLLSSVIALWFISGWLALLLFVAVVPGLIIQYRLSKARTDHWSKNIESRRKVSGIQWQLTELDYIAEIRLYGLVKYLLNLRQKYRDEDEKEQIYIERRFIKRELLANIIEAVAEVVALIYVTLQIIAHVLPVGQFLYVQQIVSRGLGAMRSVTQSFVNIDEDLVNLSAYDTFMNLPTQVVGKKKIRTAPAHIEINDVSFAYPHSERTILKHVSIELKKGEHIAIVGENGAGKSTLIKLLLGFYLPTAGEIRIDGTPTTELDLESWHSRVGVLQQSSADYNYAIAKENVLLGDVSRPYSEQRYQQAINAAEAKEFLDKLPKKDQTYIAPWMEHSDGTSGVLLSGGQKQRLALARNLYRDSPVVILDEPTSAIDALAESRIFKYLFEQKEKTIITISHRLSTVRRAGRIYVLEDGAIVEQGTHAELVKKKGAYFTLFESQL
jgi:ATP-binding cassette subfamily B protein/ATP-binding cassette subfamily C protein